MAVAGTFDVIVLDIMLPGMDGLAVCRALREEHVDGDADLSSLTARDTVADRVTGLDCGADVPSGQAVFDEGAGRPVACAGAPCAGAADP